MVRLRSRRRLPLLPENWNHASCTRKWRAEHVICDEQQRSAHSACSNKQLAHCRRVVGVLIGVWVGSAGCKSRIPP